jgi:hypothetical protein
MRLLTKLIKLLLGFLDGFILLISPMTILLFVVGVIAMIDRVGIHQGFLRKLDQSGMVTTATVSSIFRSAVSDEPTIAVDFMDQLQQERMGFIQTKYYPAEVVDSIHRGDVVNIRYLEPAYESQAILNDYYSNVCGYFGFAYDVIVMMLISWVLIIIHPEFLLLGFGQDWSVKPKEEIRR